MSLAPAQSLSGALVADIATALGASCALAPFRVAGAPVYRLTWQTEGQSELQLTLWQSLSRADVRAGECVVVFKGISKVLLFPGQEVIFQRAEPRGFLLVSCGGRVATAS